MSSNPQYYVLPGGRILSHWNSGYRLPGGKFLPHWSQVDLSRLNLRPLDLAAGSPPDAAVSFATATKGTGLLLLSGARLVPAKKIPGLP